MRPGPPTAVLLLCLLALSAGPAGSADSAAASSADTTARTTVVLSDERVVGASRFALAELRRMCEFCAAPVRDAYQALELTRVTAAATKPTTVSVGLMYFLDVELATAVPYGGAATDSQQLVVFADEAGAYTGLALDHAPFMEGPGAVPPPEDDLAAAESSEGGAGGSAREEL